MLRPDLFPRLSNCARRTLPIAIGSCLLLLGCKNQESIQLQPTIEEAAAPASTIQAGEPSASSQFLSGFGAIEGNSWRWAEPDFAVLLGVPPGAATRGAALVLAFNLPDVSIQNLKQITLSGQAGAVPLSPETYDTPGSHSYRRDLPASAFPNDTIEIHFHADKYLQLSGDSRRLSLIVTSIQLQTQ